MAWTAPRTWVAGEVMTAANMNAHVKDNLSQLVTYTSYTPALTATTTNPTLGSGSSAQGIYCVQGSTNGHVDVEVDILFGTAGVAAGTGAYRISTPFTVAPLTGQIPLGHFRLFDSSGTAYATGVIEYVSATTVGMAILPTTSTGGAATAVGAAAPWTWAANDRISARFRCRASV